MVVTISARYVGDAATIVVKGKGSTGKRGRASSMLVPSGQVVEVIGRLVQALEEDLEPAYVQPPLVT